MFMALVAVTDVLSTRIGHATLVTGEIEQSDVTVTHKRRGTELESSFINGLKKIYN